MQLLSFLRVLSLFRNIFPSSLQFYEISLSFIACSLHMLLPLLHILFSLLFGWSLDYVLTLQLLLIKQVPEKAGIASWDSLSLTLIIANSCSNPDPPPPTLIPCSFRDASHLPVVLSWEWVRQWILRIRVHEREEQRASDNNSTRTSRPGYLSWIDQTHAGEGLGLIWSNERIWRWLTGTRPGGTAELDWNVFSVQLLPSLLSSVSHWESPCFISPSTTKSQWVSLFCSQLFRPV